MCGIVGIISSEPVAGRLVEGLRRLEYRGYDSAGIATLEGGRLSRVRAEGKLINLEEKLSRQLLSGHSGIAHTRWATHGAPNEANAHPQMTPRLALVHNGIIENFAELKAQLVADGVIFESHTDTEVIAQLLSQEIETTKPEKMEAHPERAVYRVLEKLRGAYALLIIFEGRDGLMIAARRGSPIAVGYGEGEMFVGSDALALAPFTNRVQYLQDGDIAVLRKTGAQIFWDDYGDSLIPKLIVAGRPIQVINTEDFKVDKGGYPHFMLKEIYEQPDVVGRTLGRYIDFAKGELKLPFKMGLFDAASLDRVNILACGTSYYAGLIGKQWFEEYSGLHADVEVASEFRYRKQPLSDLDLSIIVSQSGETADTKEAMWLVQRLGQQTLAIVNVDSSTIAREATVVMPIRAGTEIGVASTKTFTCQLAVFAVLAIAAGEARGILTQEQKREFISSLSQVSGILSQIFKLEEDLIAAADLLSPAKHALYLGRGVSHALALEGALKLKEISYIHAEGYAAGEMKHGPIALIDCDMPVVVIAPSGELFEKTASNMEEVAARGGQIILITDEDGAKAAASIKTAAVLVLPKMANFVAPFAYAMVLQLLAYHTAVRLGRDVDQPRNLAKSVTVE